MCDVHRGLRFLAALALALFLALPASAAPVLSEIMASNKTTLADGDGDFPDWIEIHNPDATPLDLTGWFLTDNASNKTKWQFPAVSIPANDYLLVFASDKNRRDSGAELHTNFALSADGEYLGLVQPDGVTVASEFAPFPALTADRTYGVNGEPNGERVGILRLATPRAPNSGIGVSDRVQITPSTRTFADSLVVTLTGGREDQIIRYEVMPPSSNGANGSGPSASSPLYTGPFTLASSAIVRAAVFSEDGTRGAVSSALFVQAATSGEGNVSAFSSRLPVLLLDTHGLGPLDKTQGEKPGWLELFTPGESEPAVLLAAPAIASPVALKVRGSTSAEFPKKSYSIELRDDLGGARSTSLLGLATSSDWALVAPWSYDLGYVRNAYAYALSNRLGRWAPRTRFVEVFFKTGGDALEMQHYAGLSLLTERIKVAPNLVAITPLDPSDTGPTSITGGYILKFDPRDEDEFGWITDRGFPRDEGTSAGTMLVVASPKAAKLAPAQRDYIRGYVQDFENALFADRDSEWETRRYLDFIDRASWIDFHLLQVLAKNPDGLARSAYFTKDRGGKLKAGPIWDFDRAMDSTDPRSERWDEWNESTQSTRFWQIGWWGALARDPDFRQAWIDRWQSLRGKELSPANLTALAATLAAEIDPDAADRDIARWPENAARDGGSFRSEVDRLADWLTQRAQWIDQQFVARPVDITADGTRRIVAPAGLLIAYTRDGSDPRSPNGALAAGASLVSGPLVIESGTYTVRIYDASAINAFPGTPWSASVVINSASEPPPGPGPGPAPVAQLINLSTRGIVDAEHALACGLAVSSGAAKRYLVRAIGPTLASFGVPDTLPDPVLRVVRSGGGEIARNADWRTIANRDELLAATASVGAFPLPESNRDAAMIVTLQPGTYTLEITSESAARGATLAEVYALDSTGAASNLSTRSFLASDDALIGGLTLSGASSSRILVRAIGPSLGKFGVNDALSDPTLAIYNGPTLVASNDDWTFAGNASEIATLAAASGAFPLEPGSKDAAILLSVAPGGYTLQLRSKETAGSALLEVYTVP